MPDLEDEIARIAALRGKTAADYAQPLLDARAAARISAQGVRLLFQPQPDTRRDLKAYDALPEASRAFIRACPLAVNALVWKSMLETIDEAAVILAATRHITRPT